MKRGFIRALWGVFDDSHRVTNRRFRVSRNIQEVLKNKHKVPFETFVFGEKNFDELKSSGIDATLLDKEPFRFDLIKHQYRNKIEILSEAMEKYDEIVYLDWDVSQRRELPEDFWDKCGERAPIQACLQQYHRRKCTWRKQDIRKVPNGGFLYIRDKKLVERAKYWWGKHQQDNDEIAWSRVIDELMEGWNGPEDFWDNYETMYCNLYGHYGHPVDKIKQKEFVFRHFQGGT
tara:strand:- start:8587 stop:9282 length:696 start_codon:yes stop_codon:yes gene_type:complete